PRARWAGGTARAGLVAARLALALGLPARLLRRRRAVRPALVRRRQRTSLRGRLLLVAGALPTRRRGTRFLRHRRALELGNAGRRKRRQFGFGRPSRLRGRCRGRRRWRRQNELGQNLWLR